MAGSAAIVRERALRVRGVRCVRYRVTCVGSPRARPPVVLCPQRAMDGPAGGAPSPVAAWQHKLEVTVQRLLDRSTPHIAGRWAALGLVVLLYTLRVWYLRGFYIVTYALGIYNLNLLLGFLTPQVDPETEGPELPTKSDQEFRPFVRRLPEFKFW